MGIQLVCTSKNIWAELSYGFGPSCLINLGRVGKGRVLCGPSWFWAELSVIRLLVPRRDSFPEAVHCLCAHNTIFQMVPVPHKRLIKKLEGYGIKGILLEWFKNFLNGRQQRVVINGKTSDWTNVFTISTLIAGSLSTGGQ